MDRDPDRQLDPFEELEAALNEAAAETGASFTGFNLSEEGREAAGRVASLVANLGFAYTVNTSGDVIVPVEDGSSDIFIRTLDLGGEPFFSVSMVVLIDAGSGRSLKRLPEALAELNAQHPGVKFCHFPQHGTVFAYVDLPADGLETPTLLAAMRRLARVVSTVRQPLADRLGAGRPLPGVSQERGWPLEETFWPEAEPPR
jgi:hypothetical protein